MGLVRFMFFYFIFLLIVGGVIFWFERQWPVIISKNVWTGFWFLAVITLIVYLAAHFGLKMKAEYSVMALLCSIIIRFLFAMVFVVIYTVKVAQGDVVFMLNFFSLYLLFGVFEIYGTLCNLRHQNKK